MTADQGSESGRQRTVAELLEQYGGEGRTGGGRRRRRAAGAAQPPEPDAEKTPSPDSRAGRSASSDRRRDPSTPAYPEERISPGSSWDTFDTAAADVSSGTGAFDSRNGFHRPPAGADAREPDPEVGGSEWARPSSRPPLSAPDLVTGTSPFAGTGIYQAQPFPGGSIYQGDSFTATPGRRPEEPTEQLPRYRSAGGAERTQPGGPIVGTGAGAAAAGAGRRTAPAGERPGEQAPEDDGPSTEIVSAASLFDDEPDDDPDDKAAEKATEKVAEKAVDKARNKVARALEKDSKPDPSERAALDVPAGLDNEDELDEQPSNLKAWAVLIAQGVLGAVGGAVLWVAFRYLWLNFPVVALAAAVVATAGLVLVVRTIRGSEDLRTTMLAVLVGLIVTISPAVLLLTSVR